MDYEEVLLLLLLRRRRRRRKNRAIWVHEILTYRDQDSYFVNLYPLLRKDAKKFFNYFRMSITSFDFLTNKLWDSISRQDTVMRKSISVEERIAMTIRFLATGCSFEDLQNSYRCGISTISEIIREVCQMIWILMKDENIPDPSEERWKQIANDFKKRANFPNCLGAVDGKHVRIFKPQNSGSTHYNYKNYFSIILLAICDSDYKFTFVNIGAYGRHSDSTIFEESTLYKKLQENTLNIPESTPITNNGIALPYVFVGDEAFSLSRNLLCPYPGRNLPVKNRIFNYRLSRARRYVECSFGILTNKWRIFHTPMNLALDFSKDVVKACCVLHNFVRDRDGLRFEDTLEISSLEDTDSTIENNEISARIIRDKFADFFASDEGSVSWQSNFI